MSYVVLSVLIPSKYSIESASHWVTSHGFINRKIHTTSNFHRFRQSVGSANHSIKTISIGNDGIRLVIAYQEPLTGGGIIDTATTAIFGRTKYPSDQQRLIDKYGDIKVVSATIGRNPLSSFLTGILNVLTLGGFQAWMNKSPYDKLFHIYIILHLENGTNILLEKRPSIQMKVVGSYNPPKTQQIETSVPGITFKTILDNTQKKMGSGYFGYNASSNNCQVYIMSMLTANRLYTPYLNEFVYQNVSELFKMYGPAAAIVNATTGAAETADIIKKGGRI
jgi:hypothetical protein